MTKTLKILVFGYYGFGNFGDELMLRTIKEHLNNHDITVVSNDPKTTENLHSIKSISRRKFWLNPGKYDLFLLGGGTLLQNTTSNRSLYYYLEAIKRAKALGMEVYLLAQGLGPLTGRLGQSFWPRLIYKTLDGVPITVRDNQSLQLAKKIGLKANLVSDLALSFTGFPQKVIKDSSDRTKKEIIGISVRDNCGFTLGDNLDWLLDNSKNVEKEIRLLAFHKDDYQLCLMLENLLPNSYTVLIQEINDLNYFADLDLLWGMRLHSLVIAVAMGIPAMGISYDPKVAAFCQDAMLNWHLPNEAPRKEWVKLGDRDSLLARSKRSWQLLGDYIKKYRET